MVHVLHLWITPSRAKRLENDAVRKPGTAWALQYIGLRGPDSRNEYAVGYYALGTAWSVVTAYAWIEDAVLT